MYRGQIVGSLRRKEFDQYVIVRLMSGIQAEHPVESKAAL
jgi:hypothetical protein